ncbi:bacillithiol biosynthesis cysteine-adding enzyme BshC [Ornithinibacillus salinisoli]|uniref:Putative cysteine ligase BshC n=1 Tax=Ornithinibacillus salinisoli TaxID=1848459 RepID=A0ABW4VXV6_9BACI
MQVEPVHIENQSQLIRDYRSTKQNVMQHFDYTASFKEMKQRVSDIKGRDYNRDQLVDVLIQLNNQWNAPKSTLTNIERLRDENSVVVIGGQQAGILTGPLYSINKVISIVQLARMQEEKLKIPVVPVFWIAGEDHDFDEINHVYKQEKNKMKKHILKQKNIDKQSVSQIELEEQNVIHWLDELFEGLAETEYTKDLYSLITDCLANSNTYVDFFAGLIFKLFDEEGLVLIDSGHTSVRKLESNHFLNIIEKQTQLSKRVYATEQHLKQDGYSISLDVDPDDAHLFYHHNKERILLKRDEHGNWVGKQNEVKLTTEELLEIARNNPELLSNNVVTRPLMQELLFPTLAFIGGPGEISYWSVLKPAFHIMDLKMPPIMPRLSFTYMDRKVEKLLAKYNIPVAEAINRGIDVRKMQWLMSQSNPPIQKVVQELKRVMEEAHKPLRDYSRNIRADLGDLADKNLLHLFSEIEFLEGRIINTLEEKYNRELMEFDYLNNFLHPMAGLQERVWNPLFFINNHGFNFINKLTKHTCSFEQDHYVVYL